MKKRNWKILLGIVFLLVCSCDFNYWGDTVVVEKKKKNPEDVTETVSSDNFSSETQEDFVVDASTDSEKVVESESEVNLTTENQPENNETDLTEDNSSTTTETVPTEDNSTETDDNAEPPDSETSEKENSPMQDIEAPLPLNTFDRKWTIMIYMSADNNLESAAMEDICEMESSALNCNTTTVLFLVDRNSGYDTSDGDWSGTRLYKLETGRIENTSRIISQELDCIDLGLTLEKETELDLSSDYILSTFISYAKNKYPAEHFGFFMWGHGTGWRSCEENSEKLYKGFAYDESSKTYMTLHQLGEGLKKGLGELKLDLIGFDTCFGGELEVMYELKDYANYCVASEGLIMSSGWNYQWLFDEFQTDGQGTVGALCNAIVNQFKKQYAFSYRASIAVVKMSKIESLFTAFDDFSLKVASQITDSSVRDAVLGTMYGGANCKTEKYTYGTAGNDIYLDIYSLVNRLKIYFGDSNQLIKTSAEDFFLAEETAVVNSWASDRLRGGLGVYFSSLTEGNLLTTTYSPAYIKGRTVDQNKFVLDSNGYVPAENTQDSLLDKIFFTAFD